MSGAEVVWVLVASAAKMSAWIVPGAILHRAIVWWTERNTAATTEAAAAARTHRACE